MDRWLFSSISELQKGMDAGELTATALVELFLKQIAAWNHRGPCLNAVLEINPDAWFAAEALDAERKQQGPRGPLHGIPILLKDNIDTGDKMHTSAGSLALANSYATRDSAVAAKLRAAGAILLGKANMTEWANFMTDGMPNGFSSRGGQVLNPYGPGRFDVGGSSSGSAAAVAASFAVAAIGTETSGSILSPSSQNSLVGLKPTVGLISRRGIIPISFSQDTAGPMAKTVEDVAWLLGELVGEDVDDIATLVGRGKVRRDYSQCLTPDGLHGARLGVPVDVGHEEMSPGQQHLFQTALRALTEAGAELTTHLSLSAATVNRQYTVLTYEFKASLNAYLANLSRDVLVHSLAEVLQFNAAHADVALKYGQSRLVASDQVSGCLTEPEYIEARLDDLRLSRREGLDVFFTQHGLDAVVFASTYGAAIGAKAGYPSLTVPAGYEDSGEPFGITFCGPAFSEATLLKIGYAYEQATHCRVPPRLQV